MIYPSLSFHKIGLKEKWINNWFEIKKLKKKKKNHNSPWYFMHKSKKAKLVCFLKTFTLWADDDH